MKKLMFIVLSVLLSLQQLVILEAFSIRYCDPNGTGGALSYGYNHHFGGSVVGSLKNNQSFNDSEWTKCPNGDCGTYAITLSNQAYFGGKAIDLPSHGSVYVVPCAQATMGFYVWSADCDVNGSGADCGTSYCFQSLKTPLFNSCEGQGDAYGEGAR